MSKQYCKLCCARTTTLCVRVPKVAHKRQLWIQSAGVELIEGNKICEKHFSESDFYYPNASAKRRQLLPNVVPKSVFTEREPSGCGQNKFDFASQTEKEIIDGGIALENLRLKLQVSELQRKNDILTKKLEAMQTLTDSLNVIFTPSQIKRLQNGSKQVNWNTEDIAYGICLQAAGPRAYRYLLKQGFPLPCASSLLKWTQSLKLEPGPLNIVIDSMEKAVDIAQEDKLCVLLFDELKIGSSSKCDCNQTETAQQPDYVQVGMVQGLRKAWKQPIYYDYDKQMTTTVLNMLVTKLYTAGYHVVALVSSLSPVNLKLWDQLQISAEKPWFEHPADADLKVFVFANVPHLLKSIRKHFIGLGLIVNGKLITAETIKQTMNYATAADLSIKWNVTDEHLNLRFKGRQRLKLATELFSRTTASAIRRCYTLGLEVCNAWETSDFIQMVNNWFDIFNIDIMSTANTMSTQQPFGQNLKAQRKVLNDMTALISLPTLVPKSNKMLPFQTGILVSNASLDLLNAYVTEYYDMSYILTSRLSLNPLEDFFDAVYSNEGLNDHFSSMEFRYRLKKYLLDNGLVSDGTL